MSLCDVHDISCGKSPARFAFAQRVKRRSTTERMTVDYMAGIAAPPRKPPKIMGIDHLPEEFKEGKFASGKGGEFREDPQRAYWEHLKQERRKNAVTAKSLREQNIEALRDARSEMARLLGQKLQPFDEFTVFGLPSNHRLTESERATTKDCLDFSHVERRPGWGIKPLPSARANQLQKDIVNLERALYLPKRPLSAREEHRPAPPQKASLRLGSARRRPVTDIPAYWAAGLEPEAAMWLKPEALNLMEGFRRSKADEQILLGHLSLMAQRLAPRPVWKMKRFDGVRPKVAMGLPELMD